MCALRVAVPEPCVEILRVLVVLTLVGRQPIELLQGPYNVVSGSGDRRGCEEPQGAELLGERSEQLSVP